MSIAQKRIKLTVMALSLVIALFATPALATDGHQMIGLGPIQKGNGGAGVARAKDANWVVMNPATLVDLDKRFDMSIEIFAPVRTMDPNGPLILPIANHFASEMEDDSMFYIPTMSAAFPLKRGTLGFGMYGVNGMGVDYARSRTIIPQIFGKNFDRRTEYSVARLALAYGYEFDNGWSVGAGIGLTYTRFKTDMLTLGFWQTEGENEWDGAIGGSFILGVRKSWDRFAIGASYNSPQWMQRMDDYKDLMSLDLDLPQTIQAGIAWDIRDDLELVVDYKWLNWSGVEAIGGPAVYGGFGWSDQHVIKAGLTWSPLEKWTFRTGVSFGNSPIEDDDVFANALFPAVVEDHYSIGFTHKVTEKTDLHFTYMHAVKNAMTENGKGGLFSLPGYGTKISLMENSYLFGVTHHF